LKIQIWSQIIFRRNLKKDKILFSQNKNEVKNERNKSPYLIVPLVLLKLLALLQ
jgi:hypothetical protein